MTRRMTFEFTAEFNLVVHTAESPTPQEWDGYVEALDKAPARVNRILVLSRGGGPNAAQRKRLMSVVQKRASQVLLLTNSRTARAILTTLNVLAKNPMQVAEPRQGLSAVRRVFGLSAQEARTLLDRVNALLRELAEPPEPFD